MAGRLVTRAMLMLVLASVLLSSGGRTAAAGGRLVWIGTYTGPQSQGIYAFRFDDETGTLSPLGLAAETPSPSFLALHPNGKVLYAVNETHDGPGNSGMVTAFAIESGNRKTDEDQRAALARRGPLPPRRRCDRPVSGRRQLHRRQLRRLSPQRGRAPRGCVVGPDEQGSGSQPRAAGRAARARRGLRCGEPLSDRGRSGTRPAVRLPVRSRAG